MQSLKITLYVGMFSWNVFMLFLFIQPFLKVDEGLNSLSQPFLKIVIIYFDLNDNLMLRLLWPGFHGCLLLLPYLPNKIFPIHDGFTA